MATSYPGGLDAFTNPTASDPLNSATVPHATQHANANDAIEAIEAELGTNPKGSAASVKARFDAIEAAGWVTSTRILDGTIVNGDISGSAAIDPAKINGTAVVTGDSRLSDARTPTAHASTHAAAGSDPITIAQSQVTNLTTDLSAKAPAASPTFTGTVTTPLTTAGYVKTDSGGVLSSSAAIAQADVTNLTSDLAGKAAISSWRPYLQNDSAAIDTIPRWAVSTNVAASSGLMCLMAFTSPWDLTASQITMQSLATAASGLTLARMGLFTVSGDDYTLVARTASDTTLFTSQNTAYTRSFDTTGGYPATYSLVAGTRYAVGVICVGTTMPTIASGPVTGLTPLYGLAPRITTALASQSDLVTAINCTGTSTRNYWARLS